MDIRNFISFLTPVGFEQRIYVSEFEIKKFISSGLLCSWDYHIEFLYGNSSIQCFVYHVGNFRFANYLLNQPEIL